MHPLIRILLLLLFIASCSPVKNERPQGPSAPAPPAGTDYTSPGNFGKVGVDPHEPGEPTRDVPVNGWMEEGGLMGSSIAERAKWDSIHRFQQCPEYAIYVFAETTARTVANCADQQGFKQICESCKKKAYKRAVNAVRSCETAPSCRGRITQVGTEWSCFFSQAVLGVDVDGNQILGPIVWYKDCWTQYKIECISL